MAVIKRYPKGKQRMFTNDLKSLLYAYGDSASPNIETIHMLEDCVTSYLIDVITEANSVRKLQKRSKFAESDLKFALRGEPVKLGRMEDLSVLSKEITRANRMFDVSEKAHAQNGSAIGGGSGDGVHNGKSSITKNTKFGKTGKTSKMSKTSKVNKKGNIKR
ncbi:hypothetical protein CAS74_004668 [Pichia kudriavzevii]|uniref:Transcription initiation factor TFIID subunit 13 n=2 Tax=Pichia kudriavzevii TaxID=4909 RepID=A0A099P4Y8_PICKU|nr:uncharacterized protein C5L36_0B10920 [Pichia kudriavzevii]AWU75856.1 hypothetical protein C5L36_0B10920 [Pichia kudriavzevii]KGK39334.1 hypothetical protein JL09_g1523 [Pichia kudriavzevii]MDC6274400.1 transcription initiation factor TFIID subunit 13 [Lacticaseibacillus paracasei]OUT20418.1 hypothetical protein CAS74_004668 [Pichia kudriavzevii]